MRNARTRRSRQRADFIAALVKAGFLQSHATKAWRLFSAKGASDQEQQRHDDVELMTYRDAARFLATSEGTLRNWAHRKQHGLPVIKLGLRQVRFRRSSLIRWLENRELAAALVAAPGATSLGMPAAG